MASDDIEIEVEPALSEVERRNPERSEGALAGGPLKPVFVFSLTSWD